MEVRVRVLVTRNFDDSDDDNNDYSDDESECLISAYIDSEYLQFGLNIKRFKELKRCQLFPSNFGPIFTEEFTVDFDIIEQVHKCVDHFADF